MTHFVLPPRPSARSDYHDRGLGSRRNAQQVLLQSLADFVSLGFATPLPHPRRALFYVDWRSKPGLGDGGVGCQLGRSRRYFRKGSPGTPLPPLVVATQFTLRGALRYALFVFFFIFQNNSTTTVLTSRARCVRACHVRPQAFVHAPHQLVPVERPDVPRRCGGWVGEGAGSAGGFNLLISCVFYLGDSFPARRSRPRWLRSVGSAAASASKAQPCGDDGSTPAGCSFFLYF